MFGTSPRTISATEPSAADDALTLAIYHRSDDIERYLHELRAAGGLRLELIRKGTLWTVPGTVSGVLWELTPDDGAQRLVAALIANVPAVSYSLADRPGLVELSRALGFRAHLTPPLRLADVERGLGIRHLLDLADRLEVATGPIVEAAADPDVIGAVLRAVNVAPDPPGVAAAIVEQVNQWLPLPAWYTFAVEADGVPQLIGPSDTDPALRAALRSFADVIAATGAPAVRVTNYLDDRIEMVQAADRMVEVSLIGLPLVAGGTLVGGLIGLETGRARRLPTISRRCADALARLLEPAAFTLQTALRVARAEALSVTDDLTQLYNARYLNEALRKEAKRAMRSGWPLSLLFIDLDGFKAINDGHGHLAGSRALIEAADVIRASARETDIVARFGGDEFAILLPETGTEGAHSVARRLRERLQRFSFLAGVAPGSRITASIGVATLPDVADTAEGLLQAADAAMYRVKLTGKNGIHIAGSETSGLRLPTGEQEIS